MRTIAVIGKNFGDEGKGLVTASLCLLYQKPLVIKHNGGAQAGHTVENTGTGIRFVHHQIGSGAEYGADTLFADTYHPDLYQLEKEMAEYVELFGTRPNLYGEAQTKITTVDDVLLNMAIETQRGDKRHGSCGMGINECAERIGAGYEITLDEACRWTAEALSDRLLEIRETYTMPRAKQLGIGNESEYWELLTNPDVIINYAEEIKKNSALIQIVNADETWLKKYDSVIFEHGQGLLLDQDYLANAPHLTTSKTGIIQPVRFLKHRNLELQEAIYVTRSYVTKHGAGPLSHEFARETYPGIEPDQTNEHNEWQGSIRYASHGNLTDFMEPLSGDIESIGAYETLEFVGKPSLAITHLNETDGKILFADGSISVEQFVERTRDFFQTIYGSYDHQTIREL